MAWIALTAFSFNEMVPIFHMILSNYFKPHSTIKVFACLNFLLHFRLFYSLLVFLIK